MRKLPVVFLLSVVAVLALAGPASAHTEMLQTAPVDGAMVQPDVGSVSLTFTKAVDPRLATVAVRSQDGEMVSAGPLRSERMALVQDVGAVTEGRYEVQWRAAAADGHILNGDFTFRVAKSSPASPTASEDAERLSPAELLRQHAKGNFDHDELPSYAASSSESQDRPADGVTAASPPLEVGPPAALVDPAAEPSAPEPDNASTTIVALLAAALAVTSATAVVELRRT